MKQKWIHLAALISLLAALLPAAAHSQVATTTVQDTIYRADGTPATGTVVVSWNAFTTATGAAVPAGSTSATIAGGGLFSIALAPNAGSSPMGTYYTAIFHLDDGTTSREFWVVPAAVAGAGPAHLSAIRNQVLPASVAMQTVSKNYVDTAIAAAVSGHPLDSSPYVLKAGDTMTGPLVLPADPVSANQAADKNYVDENVAAFTTGLGRKVDKLPSTTQAVAQPDGTQLEVNILNGTLYASQFDTGSGGNGAANALAGANCITGCDLTIERTNTSTAPVPRQQIGSTDRVIDLRGGSEETLAIDPLNPNANGYSIATRITDLATRKASDVKAQVPTAGQITNYGLSVEQTALQGGSNQFPQNVEAAPYFKNTYSAGAYTGTYNAQGQHVLASNSISCYGVGDCLLGSLALTSSGGSRDQADEGAHPFDLILNEDSAVFTGTCATGCSTGATSITVAVTSGAGTQGEGRFLIDKRSSATITTGQLTSGSVAVPFAKADFTGTAFPVSVFLATAAAATSQPTNIAPGTVTLPIATSGVLAGYSTSTAALPASSGVACIADGDTSPGSGFGIYEMAPYRTIDSTHIQLTLNKVHATGTTIAVGGLCGYGIEQTIDEVGPLRQVFPVIGSTSATELFYLDARSAVLGIPGSTGAFQNIALSIAAISRTAGVVTLTVAGGFPGDVNGLALTIAGVADSSYNGTYTVTTTGYNTLTYASTGANSTSSGGTASFITGGYVLYPIAEVLSVYNAATKSADGTLQLAPNTVPFAAGDPLEQPHYFQQDVYQDATQITQFLPRPSNGPDRAGIVWGGNVGPNIHGFAMWNNAPGNFYLGNGGTHTLPVTAYEVLGPWRDTLDTTAPDQVMFRVGCNSHGCNKWNSDYGVFNFTSATGFDTVHYFPQTSSLNFSFGGTGYGFSPTAFTAQTINVNTLNATTITGGISASAITTGTLNPARLPVFGPSGSTHSAGAVPDPGAVAGNTRFLREDGIFTTPTLAGTTPALGGTALAAGACTTATAAVTGAVVGSPVAVAAADGSLPPAAALLRAAVTTTGTVTVQLCAVAAITPPSVAYNIRVLP